MSTDRIITVTGTAAITDDDSGRIVEETLHVSDAPHYHLRVMVRHVIWSRTERFPGSYMECLVAITDPSPIQNRDEAREAAEHRLKFWNGIGDTADEVD